MIGKIFKELYKEQGATGKRRRRVQPGEEDQTPVRRAEPVEDDQSD